MEMAGGTRLPNTLQQSRRAATGVRWGLSTGDG